MKGMVMKMKASSKLLLFGVVLALSLPMFGKSAQSIIRDARNDYYNSLKPEKADKDRSVIEYYDGSLTEEEAIYNKPKTRLEKLEYNSEKAKDRVDFYQRVVRSVQREEQELGSFNEVLGKKSSLRKQKSIKKNSGKKVRANKIK